MLLGHGTIQKQGDVHSFGLFLDVGLLKGYQFNMHNDNTVKPVAQHVYRILFRLEKVDKMLDILLCKVMVEWLLYVMYVCM